MAIVYNPTDRPTSDELTFPLYYAGLFGSCRIEVGDSAGRADKARIVSLDGSNLRLKLTVPAKGMAWIVCGRPGGK